ncbi:MAG: hypothetical protein BroJett024_17250 [Alphaproteobacteria bacterium]|nr:MAG: hypothetical protein BroJett024_17250 [Alphaproteobacteria bacterium]
MAGLVPAIHVFFIAEALQDVDARHKAGHDGGAGYFGSLRPGSKCFFRPAQQSL